MQTLDIPQANDLDTVRRVVFAAWRGAKHIDAIADFTGYSRRHTQYRVHAARVLGLIHIEGDEVLLTTRGEQLMDTPRATSVERELYAKAIESSPAIQKVAPDLLGRNPPLVDELTERLFRDSRLGAETARRRASGLLAWRRHILGESLVQAPRHPASKPPPPPHAAEKKPPAPGPTSQAEQLTLF